MNLLVGLLQALLLLTAVKAQQPHPAFSSTKHLRGIRRLPYQRYLARDEGGPSGTGRPGVLLFGDDANGSGGSYADDGAGNAQSRPRPSAPTAMRIYGNSDSAEILVPVNTAHINGVRKVPTAAVPPSFAITPDTSEGGTTVQPAEREVRPQPRQRINKPFAVVHSAPTHVVTAETPDRKKIISDSSSRQASRERLSGERTKSRLERIQARWRKIGPLIGPNGSPYQRMRLIHYRNTPVAWTHPPQETPAPTTTARPRPPPTARPTTTVGPTVIIKVSSPATSKPTEVEPQLQTTPQPLRQVIMGSSSTLLRRQPPPFAAVKHSSTPGVDPSQRSRAFSSRILQRHQRLYRPKINGPVLAEVARTPQQPKYPIPLPSLEADRSDTVDAPASGPRIVENIPLSPSDSEPEDYHHRKGMTVEKRFKLVTNKVSYRPRLKIRRPGEQFARGNSNAQKSSPISLPELTPFRSQPLAPRQRRPLQSAENTDEPRVPPRRVLPHVSSSESGFPERLPARKLPPAAAPWESAETGASSSSDGDGESGASFGGELGTPPPGFGDAFGLSSGAETLFGGGGGGGGGSAPSDENFIPEEPEQFTTTAAPRKPPTRATPRPTQRPPAPPRHTAPEEEENFVVPENSGLRPVAPPTDFKGGFGSRSGSPFSGFGGGFGGGPGRGAPGPAAPSPPRPPPRRPPPVEPVEPELKEEDFFTGDSALSPNKRGPTGDGYGPAVFPGAALPPPVPSVSVGGDAAGISPYKTQQVMDVTENTPTTVKPSALLNILNKADQGFNQVISHFEQGTPLEATAIDILEVALGSQKLDSQAKILHHLDRTIGLDNLQRIQRWANTGGALDLFKEEFLKFAKNYKPPPETKSITIPPQLEYLFQNPSG